MLIKSSNIGQQPLPILNITSYEVIFSIGRSGGNRTPDSGFGDPRDATSPQTLSRYISTTLFHHALFRLDTHYKTC